MAEGHREAARSVLGLRECGGESRFWETGALQRRLMVFIIATLSWMSDQPTVSTLSSAAVPGAVHHITVIPSP
jgi:hypothetical protein